VLLYQLLTGQLPHDTPSQVRRHAPFKRPSEINANIVAPVDALILRCMARVPSDRYPDFGSLRIAFELARQQQLNSPQYTISPSSDHGSADWSTSVIEALQSQDYLKAAKIAEAEFTRAHDFGALLQQLNALYRANRLFEFEEVFDREYKNDLVGEDGKSIRMLAIKTFLSIRKISRAKVLLDEAIKLDGESLELDFLRATSYGLEANFQDAREALESVNRKSPNKVQVLVRLIQVCEQMRDYSAAVGYLKHALRTNNESKELDTKRKRYQELGLW
jgi:serine/threonine-protein kinase